MDHKTEAQLLQAMANAATLAEQQQHAAALEALRQERTTHEKAVAASMWAESHLANTAPTPHRASHSPSTRSSDWLADVEEVSAPVETVEREMRAQANLWYPRLASIVKEDPQETLVQATGFATHTASQYGTSAGKGVLAFMAQVQHLAEVEGHPLPHVPGENAGESTETTPSDSPSLAEGTQPEGAAPADPPVGDSEVQNLDAATWPKEDWSNGDLPASGNKEARRRTSAKFNSYAEVEQYVQGLQEKHRDLVAEADAAYDRQDQGWFNAQSDEDLAVLWEISRSSFFAPYDDEVHDALYARGFDFEGHDKSMGYTASRKTAAHWEELTDPSDPGIQSRIYEMDVAGGGRMQVQQNLSGGPVLWHFISPEGYYTGASGRAATVEEAQTAAEWSAAEASGRLASREDKTASRKTAANWGSYNGTTINGYWVTVALGMGGNGDEWYYSIYPSFDQSDINVEPVWVGNERETKAAAEAAANALPPGPSTAEQNQSAWVGLTGLASRKTASISLKNVGIDGPGVGIGTDPSGKRVKFRLSAEDEADLKAILYSDMAINFSGVDIEESDLIKEGSRKTAAAPALPLLRGFGADGKHYSRHGYLEAGSAEEYWVNEGGEYRQIDQAEYEAALAKAQADPANDPYRLPQGTGSRKTAAHYQPYADGFGVFHVTLPHPNEEEALSLINEALAERGYGSVEFVEGTDNGDGTWTYVEGGDDEGDVVAYQDMLQYTHGSRRRAASRRRRTANVGDPCWSCGGKGWYSTISYDYDPYEGQRMEITCSTCGGSGVVNEPTDYPLADDPIFTDRYAARRKTAGFQFRGEEYFVGAVGKNGSPKTAQNCQNCGREVMNQEAYVTAWSDGATQKVLCRPCGDDVERGVTASRKTAAPKDGQRSYCRICGIEMEGQDYSWYALSASSPQRDVGQHHHLPARNADWPGEFNAQGDLVPGTPGGGGGQYDAPAGTIYDAGGNAIRIARRRTATPSWLEAARRVVQNHQHETVDGMLLDAFTANALVQVYDALKPSNKAKFDSMPLEQAAIVALRLI